MWILVNFRDLKKLVHEQFDHYLLNDLPAFKDKVPQQKLSHKRFTTLFKRVKSKERINRNVFKFILEKHLQVT